MPWRTVFLCTFRQSETHILKLDSVVSKNTSVFTLHCRFALSFPNVGRYLFQNTCSIMCVSSASGHINLGVHVYVDICIIIIIIMNRLVTFLPVNSQERLGQGVCL